MASKVPLWRVVLTAVPYFKIIGYLLYVVIFMVMCDGLSGKYPKEEYQSAIYKTLPIVQLIFIVYTTNYEYKHFENYKFNLMLGLLVSMGGDACLVWRFKLFIPGLVFFALAQLCYIRAFGFRPAGIPAGVLSLAIGVGVYLYLLPYIQEPQLKFLVLLYDLLIMFMAWRALALYQAVPNIGTFCGCVGAWVFVVSDLTIAVDKWVGEIENAPIIVMCTYYTAQLFIALSAASYKAPPWVVAEEDSIEKKKRS